MRKSARNIFLIPRAVRFVRSHAMLVVAALVACVTMVIVPPDSAYLGYFALVKAEWGSLIAPAFVLEGLAANLCGMIMPFGNPPSSEKDNPLGDLTSNLINIPRDSPLIAGD